MSDKASEIQTTWFLRKDEVKQRLTPEDLKLLYENSERHVLKKGGLFFLDDKPAPTIYLFDEGLAALCKNDAEGRKFCLNLLTPGDILGQLTPDLELKPVEDYIEAIRDVRLITIRAEVFHNVLLKHPEFMLRLVTMMTHRFHVLEKRFSNFLVKNVASRTAAFLLEYCEKLGEACPYEPAQVRDIELTHQEIADIICATRPVVSQALSDFAKAGYVLKHNHHLCLVNKPALAGIADMDG